MANCSHLFCVKCAQTWFKSNNICPICKKNVKIRQINLQKKENQWKLALIGLTPKEIMEAANISLDFWSFQKNYEVESSNSNLNKLFQKVKETERSFNQKLLESQTQFHKSNTELELQKTKFDEFSKKTAFTQSKLTQVEKDYKILKEKYHQLKKIYYSKENQNPLKPSKWIERGSLHKGKSSQNEFRQGFGGPDPKFSSKNLNKLFAATNQRMLSKEKRDRNREKERKIKQKNKNMISDHDSSNHMFDDDVPMLNTSNNFNPNTSNSFLKNNLSKSDLNQEGFVTPNNAMFSNFGNTPSYQINHQNQNFKPFVNSMHY